MALLCNRIASIRLFLMAVIWGLFFAIAGGRKAQSGEIVVADIFGRRLNEYGLVLVDWDGYMANPAIKFYITPPADAAFPAKAILSANNSRLYFDSPSQAGADGPTKVIEFADASARVPVFLSNFPDRDAMDADHQLSILFTGADGGEQSLTLNVHEVDQDRDDPPLFQVTVDFSQDRTGFFDDPQKRAIIQQAAEDWAYFFEDMNLDAVPVSAETTWIWNPDGFVSGHYVTNAVAYSGFLLYAYGIHSAALRSGGEPSFNGGFQSSGGVALPLKRSGGLEMETEGNYNSLGWFVTTGDDDSNLGDVPNDLYSIAHHEIGHTLVFNPAQSLFGSFKQMGFVNDPDVLAYHGSYPQIDAFDHLNGEIDNASRMGAFGYEYFGDVPRRRWVITKLDLLIAQAIGYQQRPTSAFAPLSITTTDLPQGSVSQPYTQSVQAAGGIPFYNWAIDAGALPEGLSLNSFTGKISGTPSAAGTSSFTIRVRDYMEGEAGVTMPLSITIN